MGTFEIISLIIAAVAGIASYAANQQNIENAVENREDTQKFNAEQAELANQREYNKYNDLYAPAARVEQLQKAGLSPALFYGGTGTQGTSTTGAQAQAGAAPIPLVNPILDMSSMAETMKASQQANETKQNIDNLKQQVTNMQEEVKNMKQEREESLARMDKMSQEINNLKANEITSQLQNDLLQIDKDIAEATKEDKMEIIRNSATRLSQDIEEATHRIGILEIEEEKKEEMLNEILRNYRAATKELISRSELEAQQEVESYVKAWLGITDMSQAGEKIELMRKEGKLTDKKCEEINKAIEKYNSEIQLLQQEYKTEIERTKLTGKEQKYYGAKAIAEIIERYTHAAKNLTSAISDIMKMTAKPETGGLPGYDNASSSFIY